MLRVKLVWWIPIAICIIVGIVALIPRDTSVSGTFLPYQSVIPWAPISSILIWLIGWLFYRVGRWAIQRSLGSPSL